MTAAILDELFHHCAFAAYADEAKECGGPPDSEAVRKRAYRYYEEELAKEKAANPPGAGAE